MAICELIPITRPRASSSGPPELPGLSAASVWITFSMAKPLGAVSRRWSAETTPVVSVRSRPNGLPIAIVGSPTWTALESPSSSGWRSRPSGSTRSSARSVSASLPIGSALTVCSSENVTWTSVAASTTCAFVRIRPSSSSTKPEPVDSVGCSAASTSNGDGSVRSVWARMKTTPGALRR